MCKFARNARFWAVAFSAREGGLLKFGSEPAQKSASCSLNLIKTELMGLFGLGKKNRRSQIYKP